MILAALLLALGAPAEAAEPVNASPDVAAPDSPEPPAEPSYYEHGGLWGWGLGIELPYIGVVAGLGSASEMGAGYTLGGAISYEITPSILVRASGTWDATTRARGAVSYRLSGVRESSLQQAEWLDFALGLGAAYQMRFIHPSVAPYLGADLAVTLVDGFEYRFDDELQDLTVDQAQAVQFDDGRIVGRNVGVMGTFRAGLRLHLSDWLASMLELNLSYLRAGEDKIRNTLNGPDVRTVSEDIWLLSVKFAVRIGL